MKKIFILLLAMCSMSTFVSAAQEPVRLTAGKINESEIGNEYKMESAKCNTLVIFPFNL